MCTSRCTEQLAFNMQAAQMPAASEAFSATALTSTLSATHPYLHPKSRVGMTSTTKLHYDMTEQRFTQDDMQPQAVTKHTTQTQHLTPQLLHTITPHMSTSHSTCYPVSCLSISPSVQPAQKSNPCSLPLLSPPTRPGTHPPSPAPRHSNNQPTSTTNTTHKSKPPTSSTEPTHA